VKERELEREKEREREREREMTHCEWRRKRPASMKRAVAVLQQRPTFLIEKSINEKTNIYIYIYIYSRT